MEQLKWSCIVIGLTALVVPVVCSIGCLAQGKMVLVGGGSEQHKGWSDQPYGWAIENSLNKKVAVISYSDEDDFIPDYFKSLGAADAVNFKIDSRAKADLQSTYDALMQYDVFFLKGGDQSKYYLFFKNTKTSQAIVDKFNEGGVLAGTSAGMAILSGVVFTAEHDSVYPDEILQDFMSNKITLRSDFLPFFPSYIFDTHLTERGRGVRLMGFMARWYVDEGELLTGIGVDDRTAFCIDANRRGIVFGTGAVSIYSSSSYSAYQDDKLVADSIHVTQLLHGHVADLQPLKIINGPDGYVDPAPVSEDGNYELILSGREGVDSNNEMLAFLIQNSGKSTDTVLIVTAPGRAQGYRQKLQDMDADFIVVETTSSNNATSQSELRNQIRRSKKILFVENDDDLLFTFLTGGPTGSLVKNHARRDKIISAFAGEDSRYAGKVFVTNHRKDQYAAYYGRLDFSRGLGLLKSTLIMPNTYDEANTDFYENTTASVTYGLLTDSLKYGVYLNRNSFVRFFQISDKNFFESKGDLSSVVVINSGTTAALASQPVNLQGNTRNYVGFSDMQFAFLNGDNRILMGVPKSAGDLPYEFEIQVVAVSKEFDRSSINLFPNPSSSGIFRLTMNTPKSVTLTVFDSKGMNLTRPVSMTSNNIIDIAAFPDGLYFLRISSDNQTLVKKIIKGENVAE